MYWKNELNKRFVILVRTLMEIYRGFHCEALIIFILFTAFSRFLERTGVQRQLMGHVDIW